MTDSVADMTVEELQQLVIDLIDKIDRDNQRKDPTMSELQKSVRAVRKARLLRDALLAEEKQPESAKKIPRSDLIRMEQAFVAETFIPSPAASSEKERKATAELWWQPLRRMATQCEGDTPLALEILKSSINKLRDRKLTVSSPKSIEKEFTSQLAYRRSEGSGGRHVVLS